VQTHGPRLRSFLTESAIAVGRSLLSTGLSRCIPDAFTKLYLSRMNSAMDSAPARVFSSHGSKLFFPPDCPVDAAMVLGTYELGTTRLLMRELRTGMVFFDIGAHVGYYTCLAARLVGPVDGVKFC